MKIVSCLVVSFSALAALAWTSAWTSVDANIARTRVPMPAAGISPGAVEPAARAPARGSSPLVVIDPGHGGTNTGAPGIDHGFYEKQLTLRLARRVARRLRRRGVRAVLTRDRDEYVTLRRRVQMANQMRADLFISLHANATRAHLERGYETFVLSPRAMDIDGRALRMADGAPRAGVDRETAHILDDLERGMAQDGAAALAVAIQDQLRGLRGSEGDRGVRQDAMHVLMGATMPAVLVEVGFVDHEVEGRELRDPGVQAGLCDALARAIERAVDGGRQRPRVAEAG